MSKGIHHFLLRKCLFLGHDFSRFFIDIGRNEIFGKHKDDNLSIVYSIDDYILELVSALNPIYVYPAVNVSFLFYLINNWINSVSILTFV